RLSPRTVWLAWTGGRGVATPRGVGARTRVAALGFVARLFGPPRAALSWLVPEPLRLGSLTVPRGFAVAGRRATTPTALTRPPGGPVLLELSEPLEPGMRELVPVVGDPVPVEELPTAVEPPANGPPALIPAPEVPPPELVEEGAVMSIKGPTAGIVGPGLAG